MFDTGQKGLARATSSAGHLGLDSFDSTPIYDALSCSRISSMSFCTSATVQLSAAVSTTGGNRLYRKSMYPACPTRFAGSCFHSMEASL